MNIDLKKLFRITRIVMIVFLIPLIGYCLYFGVTDVMEGKFGYATIQFVCLAVDVTCLIWWIKQKV